MSKQKNSLVASLITIVIIGLMAGSVHGLQSEEAATKPNVVIAQPVITNQVTPGLTPPSITVVVAKPATATSTPSPTAVPATSTPVNTPTPTVIKPTPTPPPAPAPLVYIYKDGSYPVTVSYYVPGTVASLAVTLNIASDTISASSVTDPPSTDPTSKNWDRRFINDYQQYVVGHKLSGLNLANTSGASLTTNGFNNALNQIRTAAHA